MTPPFSVGAVIPMYWGWPVIDDTLRALLGQTEPPSRVVVVDNGDGGDAVRVREAFPSVTVVEPGGNLGYAGAINLGARTIRDDGLAALLMLTQECVMEPDALAQLGARLRAGVPMLAAVGPLLGWRSRPDRVWSAGGALDRKVFRPSHHGAGSRMDSWRGGLPQRVDWLDGACVLVATEALRDVDDLDESFFMYYEDVDLGLALRYCGYDVECVPNAWAWQEPSGVAVSEIGTRNRLRVARKHGGVRAAARTATAIGVEELDPDFYGLDRAERRARLRGTRRFWRAPGPLPPRRARSIEPDSRPRVVFVTDAPAGFGFPTGFGPRLFHLLRSLGARFRVETIAVDRQRTFGTVIDAETGVAVQASAGAAPRPSTDGGSALPSTIRRWWRAFGPGAPTFCHPMTNAELTAAMADPPDLVVLHFPRLAHLARLIPAGVPVIALLEERESSPLVIAMENWSWGRGRRALARRRELTRERALYRVVARRAASIVVISEEQQGVALELTRGRGRVEVLEHGVDVEHYAAAADTARDIDVLVVGAGVGERSAAAIGDLVTAAAARGWRWTVVGDGSDALRGVLPEDVTVTGAVPDVRPFYDRGQVVVVLSPPGVARGAGRGAGAKTTILEAWAMGRAVVAAREAVVGVPAEDGTNILVGRSTEDVVDLIAGLLSDADRRDAIAAAGRATVVRERDIRAIAERFTALCVSIVETRASGSPSTPLLPGPAQ